MGSIGSGGSSSTKSYSSADWNPAIKRWAIQNDEVSEDDRKAIEAFISQAPPVTNKLSRGLSMSDEELSKLQVGAEFTDGKLASWSTRVGIAQAFARRNVSEAKPNQVVFRLDEGTDQGGKIGGLGGRRYDEGEVIMSGKAGFVITKIKRDRAVNGYTTVWVKNK